VLNASVNTVVSGVIFPPEWLPTSSTGPASGCCPARGLAPEPDACHQPQHRQPLTDVVRVALVEVRARNPPLRLVGDLMQYAFSNPRCGAAPSAADSGIVTCPLLLGRRRCPSLPCDDDTKRPRSGSLSVRSSSLVLAERRGALCACEEAGQQRLGLLGALDLRHVARSFRASSARRSAAIWPRAGRTSRARSSRGCPDEQGGGSSSASRG